MESAREVIKTNCEVIEPKVNDTHPRKVTSRPSQKWFYQEIPYQRKKRKVQPEPDGDGKKAVKAVKTSTRAVQTKLKEKDSEVSKRLLQVEKISNLILSEVRNCLVRNFKLLNYSPPILNLFKNDDTVVGGMALSCAKKASLLRYNICHSYMI